MFTKYFIVPVVLSIAGLFLASDPAQAQRRGPSRGGNVTRAAPRSYVSPSRGGNVTRAVPRSYVSPGRANTWQGGTWRDGAYRSGYGRYWRPGYYGGYWWPGGYYPGWYAGYSDAYSYYIDPSAPYGEEFTSAPNPTADNTAGIRVILPNPSARVWFDGALTQQTGADRLFHTPPLTSRATYRIKATWMQDGREVTQERTAAATPNQLTVIDFRRPIAERLPSPAAK